METKIIAFAGKMQSGKDSSCNLLYALALRNVLKMTDYAELNSEGKIVAESAEGEKMVLNVDSRDPEFMQFMGQSVWPFMRKFSFAEPIKDFGTQVLGLNEASVWGTNEEKNKPTHLKWEDMPVPLYEDLNGSKFYSTEISDKQKKALAQRTGFMTGREVMEYFGTQIVRKMYNNAWAEALIRKINLIGPQYATICDVRFPNEVEAIKKSGGKVIRLTLITPEAAENKHISNTALDEEVYDWNNFDLVLDNQNMTMKESHDHLLDWLVQQGILELKEVEGVE